MKREKITRISTSTATALVSAALLFSVRLSFANDQPSVEDRLKALENTVQTLQKENKDLKAQLGWDGKSALTVAKPAGKENKLNIGGYIQANAEFGHAPDARFNNIEDRFLIRRARLGVNGSFAEHFDFKLEGDFGANSLSEKTGYSAQITDAFINWNQFSFANVKIGQFKTPFGYEQLLPDTKLLTVERSLANDRLTDSRQIGLGVAGNFFAKRLAYSAGMFNGSGVNNSFNDNNNFMYAGRITGVAYQGKLAKQDTRVAIGVNGLTVHDTAISKSGFGLDSTPGGTIDNLFTGNRTSWGVDGQFSWGPVGLDGEYLRTCFKPSDNIPSSSFEAAGWYVTATCFIVPSKLQALVRYEELDPNLDLKGDLSHEYVFGLNYYIKGDSLKLSANYLLGHPAGKADNQGRFLTRVQVVF